MLLQICLIDMEITKREIIVSVAIVAIMLTVGIFISSYINSSHIDKVQEYNTALPVDTKELFEYGMKTSVGNAFVYGELTVVDPVSYEEIDGDYWYVKRTLEEYRKHTRVVEETYKDRDGKTKTRTKTEEYWTWDAIRSDSKSCTTVVFLGVTFDQSKFGHPYSYHIDTVSAGHHKRYVFNGVPTEFKGTIYTKLYDGDISRSNSLRVNQNIDEAREALISFNWVWVFWVFWVLLIAGLIVGFYYIDNRWLE